jgi:pimeloyl-ACP methyl ester carboxylesterase
LRQGITGSRVVQFEHSSHTAHLEETDAYLTVVRAFLADADAER